MMETMLAPLDDVGVEPENAIETRVMVEAEANAEAPADDVFSLTTLLDPSAGLAAARRLYHQNRNGLRFFCENRRVVPLDEVETIGDAFEEDGEVGCAPG